MSTPGRNVTGDHANSVMGELKSAIATLPGFEEPEDETAEMAMSQMIPDSSQLKDQGISTSALSLAGAIETLNEEAGKQSILNEAFALTDPPLVLAQKFRQAAYSGAVNVLRSMLLEHKVVDINQKHPQTKQTALHVACAGNQFDSVVFLTSQNDIELEPKDSYGNTPLALVQTGKDGERIRKLLETKISASLADNELEASSGDGTISTIIKRYGNIAPVADGHCHLFICHDYANHVRALDVFTKLTSLGVRVSMTEGLMTNSKSVKSLIGKSKLVLVLGSKQFLSKMSDMDSFSTSPAVLEMRDIMESKDVSQILVAALDTAAEKSETWEECYEISDIMDEGLLFDLKNDKALNENLPRLYNEIKVRSAKA